MPNLPRNYVALAEVDDLIDQLTSSPKAAVAGLTGEGGTGKSVLASAVAHEVHSRFAAGVHWVTVGEHATSEDVRQMQQELLISLGEPMATQLRDLDDGKDRLAKALVDRPALLIIDDVWHPMAGSGV